MLVRGALCPVAVLLPPVIVKLPALTPRKVLRVPTSPRGAAGGGRAGVFAGHGHHGLPQYRHGGQRPHRQHHGFENTATGGNALFSNITGNGNTATGGGALQNNTTGGNNTATGVNALDSNTTGSNNTAVGFGANVFASNLTNATAIGANAVVDASNKIRLGNSSVTVIQGQVGFTSSSDVTQKEHFQPVDGETVLRKLRKFVLTSWNFIGHDPTRFRHYGPSAQEFFAAFGHDGVGTIGTPTTITSTDLVAILMIAIQALERRTMETAALKARLEVLERLVTSHVALTASAEPAVE